MKKHKKTGMIIGGMLISFMANNQTPPTGSPPPNNTTDQARAAWYRGGNNNVYNSNNIFGTRWNSPIYTISNSTNRMKLNGNVNYTIDGYAGARNGFLLLGENNSTLYNSLGAYSRLHINGESGVVQQGGYRPWMKTGITLTDNLDLSYFGLRQVGTGTDVTETTITWSDNAGNTNGPDDLVFRFTGEGAGNNSISTDLTTQNDLDGLHIARFTPTGLMGLGNTFGINAPGTPLNLYVRPQSLLHMSLNGNNPVWSQYTNKTTGESATDGLRIGIALQNNVMQGYIRWQEYTPFIVQTANSFIGSSAQTGERLRITSIGALLNTEGNFGGLNSPTNRTRIAISADGASPITRPLSLLHLGYNTGTGFTGTFSGDGWRNWMDLGIFTSNGTDNVYIGLKNEGTGGNNDRFDAVINWGDNQNAGPNNQGPDNLRFIFTNTQTSTTNPGDPISMSQNGLEVARMVPDQDNNGLTNSFGKLGVGDFYTIPTPVTHKLHVRGNARLEYVPDMVNAEYLMLGEKISPSNNEDLEFHKLAFPNNSSQVLLGNGTWGSLPPSGGVGNYCSNPQNPLVDDYVVPLDIFNYYFSGQSDDHQSMVFIGMNCGTTINSPQMAKLNVLQESTTAYSPTDATARSSVAGYFVSQPQTNPILTASSVGIRAEARNSNKQNIGLDVSADGTSDFNYGIWTEADGATNNMGIFSKVGSGTNDYAAYLIGDLHLLGDFTGTGSFSYSDAQLKTNIDTISNPLQTIMSLSPKTYFMDTVNFQEMRLSSPRQYGFLAQEVEQILPELVKNNPPVINYDSLGNTITQTNGFKSLNYTAFTSIIVGAMQEQQHHISVQDSIISDLNNRLMRLEECLKNILPELCEMNQRTIEVNSPELQEEIRQQLSVILTNKEVIILDQNIPNPFAETTEIEFSIPESVRNAQIIFYNNGGQLIKSVDINERGKGTLTVYGNDLSTGIYSYTLFADGKAVATKKMIKR